MRIGIMSDSHGNMAAIDAAVAAAGPVELWLHAGDCCPDARYLQVITQTRVVNVSGNCDWPSSRAKDELVFNLSGHRIFLTHGHTYGVRYTTDMLAEAAAEKGADIVVYGHTHVVDQTPGEAVFILNPGSVARPRDELRSSFMLLDLLEDQPPRVKLIRLAQV